MRKTFQFKKFSIDLVNEWMQLIKKYNWSEFNWLQIRTEKENIHGMFEIELGLLGFGIRIYWTWNKKMLLEKAKEYDHMLNDSDWYELKKVPKKKNGK